MRQGLTPEEAQVKAKNDDEAAMWQQGWKHSAGPVNQVLEAQIQQLNVCHLPKHLALNPQPFPLSSPESFWLVPPPHEAEFGLFKNVRWLPAASWIGFVRG